MVATEVSEPPVIENVRRSYVDVRGVRFHVTEAGPPDGRPVLALHGWPQHHWVYRDLLANPPRGLRIIAPDLPGYGWSGPAPHRWAKDDVAADLLALMDELGLGRTVLVGHDWGGYVAHLMALAEPRRFDVLLPMNIPHPWVHQKDILRRLWRFGYQPIMAAFGVALQRHTAAVWVIFAAGSGRKRHRPARDVIDVYVERFRTPLGARTGRDTYRTFLLRELPARRRNPEKRRSTVPIRVLFGMDDMAIHPSLASPKTARADDYTFEAADAGHFIIDERPDLLRAKLIAITDEFPAPVTG